MEATVKPFNTIKLLIIVALLSTCQLLSLSHTAHAQKAPVKNIVLVHGAFADASGW